MSSNCCNNYWFFCIFYIFLREFDKNQKFFCFFLWIIAVNVTESAFFIQK
ncbi:hypothetical protein CU024_1943 [Enterococcus faecium]|nr:hypothetical protein HMPREF9523_00118 [Enterococcus faecium TX0133A]EJX55685.1 hypothetical protein HMPREF1379_00963 [Enterococcus faecium R497]EJX58610.1 hypothetical protein HMPREF1376_02846 [Enterococcus faecium R446]EJX86790.1 hypothetical protein HMPREF1366_03365 [Enterococcus faecium ERV26]EJX87271.1 hypothetical protein HMPREF1367_02483 [Enterococcus faecium ERV38]EJX97942.1 hypothetical protein HMPREF1363_02840 [Enterococcus faecium ERV161]MBK4758447.1 hypothetical protein [Enteroc